MKRFVHRGRDLVGRVNDSRLDDVLAVGGALRIGSIGIRSHVTSLATSP
jgi:hypothetical protein